MIKSTVDNLLEAKDDALLNTVNYDAEAAKLLTGEVRNDHV